MSDTVLGIRYTIIDKQAWSPSHGIYSMLRKRDMKQLISKVII